MTKLFVGCLMLCCWISASSSSGLGAAKTLDHGPLQCRDFLAQMHLSSRGVRYTGCEILPDRQGKPLRATWPGIQSFDIVVECYTDDF